MKAHVLAIEAEDLWIEDRRHTRLFRGTEQDLVATGLVQADWLPGKQGRNANRQTIFFNGDGSYTFRGNGGGQEIWKAAAGRQWVTITHNSRNRYAVERGYLPTEALRSKLAEDVYPLRCSLFRDRDALGLEACRGAELFESSFRLMREIIGVPHARRPSA